MLLYNTNGSAGGLQEQLHGADHVTPQLMSRVLAHVAAAAQAPELDRVRREVSAEAWTDAALDLIEATLPGWKLRRLVHDDGEWWCMLCRTDQLPDWLDETVETHHVVLPLAILEAALDAACRETASPRTEPATQRPASSELSFGVDDYA